MRSRSSGRRTSSTSWTATTASPPPMAVCGFASMRSPRRWPVRPGRRSTRRSPPRSSRSSLSTCRPARTFMGDVGAVPLGFLAAALRHRRVARGRLAGLVSAARVPAVRAGRDGDAVAAGRSFRRARVGGAPVALLPAAPPAGRGASRHSRALVAVSWRGTGATALCGAGVSAGCGWWARGGVDGDSWRHFSPALIIIGTERDSRRDDAAPKLARLARLPPRRLRGRARVGWRSTGCASTSSSRPVLPGHGLRRSRGSCRCRAALFLAFGLYRGLWRFASLLDLQRIVARRRAGRAPDSARARDAAAADGRAAQRARLLSGRADLPDGGRSLRLPDLEGASALQPVRWLSASPCSSSARAKRARGSPWSSREAGTGAWSGCSTTITPSRAGCCAT